LFIGGIVGESGDRSQGDCMLRAPLAHGQIRGTIPKTVLAWCDTVIGVDQTNAIAAAVAKKHDVDPATLRDSELAMSYLVVEDLYPPVIAATGDRDAIYKAGLFSANMQAVGIFLFGVVRLMGGTRFVYQKTADLTPRFANTGTMRCVDVGENTATIEFEMYRDLRCTVAGFDYRRGLLATAPLPFGAKRHADVEVLGCQARGDPKDVFRCRW
jgi:hypothetical protein